jgi:hypothetical protein
VSEALSRARRVGREALQRAVFEAKTVVAKYPSVAIPIARRRHGVPGGDDTEIVIEGFPRTGTSFAIVAFEMAQGRDVRVAGHVHAAAQVIEGARRSLPDLVIIRDPEDTVLSFVIRNPHISIRQALRGYLRFHEPLLRHRDGFVVGTFDQVTADFGTVVDRVNERFGTSFTRFEHTDANVRRCFEAIDDSYGRRVPRGEGFERQVARPSEWRAREKEELRSAYRADDASPPRRRAERVFRALADAAGR